MSNMQYSSLSIDQLIYHYLYPEQEEERDAIDKYVASLPQADVDYFEHLKRRNNEEAYETLSAIQNAEVFRMDDSRIILFDRDSFNSCKGYIDELLKECSDLLEVSVVIESEKVRAADRIAELGKQVGRFTSFQELKQHSAKQRELRQYIEYLNNISTIGEDNKNVHAEVFTKEQPLTTETQKLKERLLKYGFDRYIENNSKFKKDSVDKIINILSYEKVPFRIALLYNIGFIDFIEKEYSKSSGERDSIIGKILDTADRRAKGNINVLKPGSDEDRDKYTSHHHIESVEEKLKGL